MGKTKRMVSTEVTRNSAFTSMSDKARLLYYELVQDADDDGIISTWNTTRFLVERSASALRTLLERRYILGFENDFYVIKHWLKMNSLRQRIYRPSAYTHIRSHLLVKEDGTYTLDAIQGMPLDKYLQKKYKNYPQENVEDMPASLPASIPASIPVSIPAQYKIVKDSQDSLSLPTNVSQTDPIKNKQEDKSDKEPPNPLQGASVIPTKNGWNAEGFFKEIIVKRGFEDIHSVDRESYLDLFDDLIAQYPKKIVANASTYVIHFAKNKRESEIINKYAYFSSSVRDNCEKLVALINSEGGDIEAGLVKLYSENKTEIDRKVNQINENQD